MEKRGKQMSSFDPQKTKDDIVKWIRDFFEKNGNGCNAVVGISGGKDSSIVAALCVEALGKDRVIGVTMPNGCQGTTATVNEDGIVFARAAKDDEEDNSIDLLVNHLGIKCFTIPITEAYGDMIYEIVTNMNTSITEQTLINLAPRLRMSMLYAVSQTVNGRVANTCNLSEDWIGYSTRYGDSVGDFSPLSKLTVTEVKEIGHILELPSELVEKVPSDDLCGKTDEDNLGFTYAALDKYIREGICDDEEIKAKIDTLHEKNLFKLQLMPIYDPEH